ncbi:homocysteine S-methyltransferase family protein [bacterium]
MSKFIKKLNDKNIIMFDGGLGTMLLKKGVVLTENPLEILNVEQPEIVRSIHEEYVKSGADVLTTNTFGLNRYKLAEYGLADRLEKLCLAGVKIARDAAKGKAFVAGGIGPIGKLVKPLGELDFEEAYEIYKEAAHAFEKAKPDVIILETMLDIQEVRAACLAIKETTDIPFIVSMTYESGKRTTTGSSPEVCAAIAESLSAVCIGANCSTGPEELYNVAEKLISTTNLPVLIQANAGNPIVKDGQTIFPLNASDFSKQTKKIAELGVKLIGGCCGTSPEHIFETKKLLKDITVEPKPINTTSYLTSRTSIVKLSEYPIIVGERINPSGVKKVRESILAGDYSYIFQEAGEQIEKGADVLDVNVSHPDIDEAKVMHTVVSEISKIYDVPLSFDSSSIEALERGLRYYPGKALVNSTDGEMHKMSKVLPLVKKYGASIVCLTMDENGIPETTEQRVKIAEKIIKMCDKIGIARKDIFVDTLTLAISTEPDSAMKSVESLKLIKKQFGVRTFLGLSNISYGLPNRQFINTSFLTMAIAHGLDAALTNPKNDQVRGAFAAAALLRGSDRAAKRYLGYSFEGTQAVQKEEKDTTLFDAILRGNKTSVDKLFKKELENTEPLDILNKVIIPALDEVGRKYDKGEYFLPQLLYAAEAAEAATENLQKIMSFDKTEKKAQTIIFATVKGDLHDIGKNIVISVLKNYGYKIIDLGKNIDAENIIQQAIENNADVIALSALMTTTMKEMEKVIQTLDEKNIRSKFKVILGGAVVNDEYTKKIGADGYSKDPIDSIKLLKKLMG